MPQSSLDINQWQVHNYMFALHPQFPTFHSSTPPLLLLPLTSPYPHSLLHSHCSLLPNMLLIPALPLSPSILLYNLHSLFQPLSSPPLTSPYPNSLFLLHSPHFQTHLTPLLFLFHPLLTFPHPCSPLVLRFLLSSRQSRDSILVLLSPPIVYVPPSQPREEYCSIPAEQNIPYNEALPFHAAPSFNP